MKILKNKRGVQLTMQTIVIAVLVIVVLIVLVLIFSKSARNFFLGTSGCEGKEGRRCDPDGECESDESHVFSGDPQCQAKMGDDAICCEKETTILGIDNMR